MNLPNSIQAPLTPTPTAPTASAAAGSAQAVPSNTGTRFGMDFAQIMANQLAQMPALQQQAFASSESLAQALQAPVSQPQEAPTSQASADATHVLAQLQASQPAGTPNSPPNSAGSTTSNTENSATQDDNASSSQNSSSTQAPIHKNTASTSTTDNSSPAYLANFLMPVTPITLPTPPSGNFVANAPPLADGNPTANLLTQTTPSSLQTVALSQNLSVITPAAQATNPQSLTAFAQSMGLDENAISQLMANAAKSNTSPAGAPLPPTMAATPASPSGLMGLSNSPTMATSGTTPITPSATLLAALNMQSNATPTDATASTDVSLNAQANTTAQPAASGPAANTLQMLQTQNQLLAAHSATSDAASAHAPAMTTVATPTTPVNDWQAQMQAQALTGSTPMASPVVTKTVATSTEPSTTDWIDTGLSEADVSALGTHLSLALPAVAVAPVATPNGAPGAANNPTTLPMMLPASTSTSSETSATNSANAAPSEVKQLETIDALSDKLTTEMATRINKQLADGQWKMKFGLRPANLGGVEIQLEMNDGKLNTHFNVDNPVTAHLLQNASDRLRSTLESFGIQPGQVQVGSQAGGGQQNPSQQSTNTSQFVDNSGVAEKTSQEETTEQPTSGRKDSSSGLDLYA